MRKNKNTLSAEQVDIKQNNTEKINSTPLPPGGGPGLAPYTPRTTTYSVISISNLEMFITAVNNFLKDGWQLQGGVSVSHIANDYNVTVVYSQAVSRIN